MLTRTATTPRVVPGAAPVPGERRRERLRDPGRRDHDLDRLGHRAEYHVWVDYEGELHQLSESSATPRRGRGIQLTQWPDATRPARTSGATSTVRRPLRDLGRRPEGGRPSYKRYTTSILLPPVRATRSTRPPCTSTAQDIVAYTTTDGWRLAHDPRDHGRHVSTSDNPSGGKFKPPPVALRGADVHRATATASSSGAGTRTTARRPTPRSDYYMYYGAKSFVGSLYTTTSRTAASRTSFEHLGGCNKTVGSALTSISFSTQLLADRRWRDQAVRRL